jgi:zinc transporter ZupT
MWPHGRVDLDRAALGLTRRSGDLTRVLKCQAWRNRSRAILPLLGWIILFTAVGGIASAAFAGLFLLLPEQTGLRMLPHFVSFATGALIGAALLGLLPEAMETVGPGGAHAIGVALVVGLGVFFIIEKLVLWRHAHSHEHEDPTAREVVAHGVTDVLAHDDGGDASDSDAARSVGASERQALRVVGAAPKLTTVAFAGDVGGHAHTHERGDPHGHGQTHGHTGRGSIGVASGGHDHGDEHNPGQRHHRGPTHGREQSLRQSHSHGGHDHSRDGAAGVLVLIGDSIHNTLDGILIAAAFLTSVPLGLVTTLAVAAHEIPHRVGDFALLLHAGMSRQRAMFLNMATGLASVLGGIAAYFGLSKAQEALPYALALAAAGFLYIAVAGLIPGLHRRADPRTSLAQVLLMGAGVGVIAWAEALTH